MASPSLGNFHNFRQIGVKTSVRYNESIRDGVFAQKKQANKMQKILHP
jgi:hypothetical protein